MSLALLAPAFLLGLLALAVPLYVHLRRRERREALAFPSLMFLRRIPLRETRRRKLRDVALLLLRCAALVLLALAFARPFLREAARAEAALGARARVVVLDASGSMAYGDRWQRARTAALAELDGLAPGEQVGLVLFSDTAVGAAPPADDPSLARAALAEAAPLPRLTRAGPALRLAAEWLATSTRPRRELVIVSDFQRNGFELPEDLRLPPGCEVRAVGVGAGEVRNASLTSLTFDRGIAGGRERVAIGARAANASAAPLRGLRATLELGGRSAGERALELPASGAASVAFEPVAFPSAASAGVVRIAEDALASDDARHFVLAPGASVATLLAADAGAGRYLARALAIGDRPRFAVAAQGVAGVSDAALAGRDVAVVALGAPPPAAAAAALDRFVRAGHGALLALAASAAEARWSGAGAALLPGTLRGARDRTAEFGATLAFLDYDHEALALFKAPRSGDFSAPRFLRYAVLEPGPGARVLARLDDGAPALVEEQRGEGRLLVWTSALDALASDLPLQPIFLPLVQKLLAYAAARREAPAAFSVGEVWELPVEGDAELEVELPSGRRQRLQPGQRQLELGEIGAYTLRRVGGGEAQARAAANLPAAESDLASADAEELVAALLRARGGPAVATQALTLAEQETRQSLWWYLLGAALLLLAAETLLANRPAGAAAVR
ncbi:MAG: BatA domain-containing protein [Vicinamibacteria bacterium]